MKTLAIIVASFWVVTAAMADDSCAVPGDRQELPARRRLEQLSQEMLQGLSRGAEATRRGADELHQEVHDRRRRVLSH